VKVLSQLVAVLSRVENDEARLAGAAEAVDLALIDPAAVGSGLVESLSTLGSRLSRLRQLEEVLAAGRTAVTLWQQAVEGSGRIEVPLAALPQAGPGEPVGPADPAEPAVSLEVADPGGPLQAGEPAGPVATAATAATAGQVELFRRIAQAEAVADYESRRFVAARTDLTAANEAATVLAAELENTRVELFRSREEFEEARTLAAELRAELDRVRAEAAVVVREAQESLGERDREQAAADQLAARAELVQSELAEVRAEARAEAERLREDLAAVRAEAKAAREAERAELASARERADAATARADRLAEQLDGQRGQLV
jgi:hypothetical protein